MTAGQLLHGLMQNEDRIRQLRDTPEENFPRTTDSHLQNSEILTLLMHLESSSIGGVFHQLDPDMLVLLQTQGIIVKRIIGIVTETLREHWTGIVREVVGMYRRNAGSQERSRQMYTSQNLNSVLENTAETTLDIGLGKTSIALLIIEAKEEEIFHL
ncbi:hypothetical protein BC829DRAFT_404952 [Chytridium lagenaria]|nr:hypothetical protein BC829DRAFT_404952 [Chytridium lagenaria]